MWIILIAIAILMQLIPGQSIWDMCPLVEPVSALLIDERGAYAHDTISLDPDAVAAWTGHPLVWSAAGGFYARRLPEFVQYRLFVTNAGGLQVAGLITPKRGGEWFAYLTRDLPENLADEWHVTCGVWRLDEVVRP